MILCNRLFPAVRLRFLRVNATKSSGSHTIGLFGPARPHLPSHTSSTMAAFRRDAGTHVHTAYGISSGFSPDSFYPAPCIMRRYGAAAFYEIDVLISTACMITCPFKIRKTFFA